MLSQSEFDVIYSCEVIAQCSACIRRYTRKCNYKNFYGFFFTSKFN